MAVTSVSSSTTDIAVASGTTTPVLTLNKVNNVTKTYYDPTSSIQTQLNSKARISVYTLIAAVNTDITTTLQTALNTYKEVIIDGSPGQYLINDTLTMPSNVILRGVNNAQLTCGNSPSSSLSVYMQYIKLTNNNNVISNITFNPSPTGFPSLTTYGPGAIYMEGANSVVEDCTFNFSFAYDKDVYAVWVANIAALYNKILNNKCYTVGIRYAENGASYNIADGNYILNAGTIGLEGTGNNPSVSSKDNIVSNNIVVGAGLIGIEDQQNINGTIITNNIVLNSGLSPNAWALGSGMAISAAANNTQVIGNEINGFLRYGIESGGSSGSLIKDNNIIDLTYLQTAIFGNNIYPHGANDVYTTSIIDNTITGSARGIRVQGDYTAYLNIQGNTLKDFDLSGIEIITAGIDTSVNIVSNTIILTTPNTAGRTAISSYTGSFTTHNGYIRFCNNNVNYSTTINGGAGGEVAFQTLHAGALVENNTVNTNGAVSAWGNIVSYYTNGYAVDGVKYINNKSYGTYAVVYLNTSTNIVLIGNNWPGGDRLQMSDEVSFAYDGDYTVSSAATLTKLLNITANRYITLPAAADYAGKTLKIWNQNITGFTWNFATTVRDASSATITALANTSWYVLESDGNDWVRIS